MLKALHLLQLTSRQGWLVFLFTAYLEFEGVVIRRLQGKPCEGLSSMFSERGEGHLSPLFSRNETYKGDRGCFAVSMTTPRFVASARVYQF